MQYERVVKENEILNQRLNKAQHDYENQLMQSDQLAGENSHKSVELKLKEDEINNLKGDITRINKIREGLNRKLRQMEDQKSDVESSRESLRQHIASLERGRLQCAKLRCCIPRNPLQRFNLRESNLIWIRKLMMIWLERETF